MKKSNKPKLKGRERRLAKAPEWIITHRGKPANMLKRYRKAFAVDWECAITELKELGVKFGDLYLSRLRETIAQDYQDEKKHIPISRAEFDIYRGIVPDYDENFAYIAGYTSGDVPYGVTWEEMEELADYDAMSYNSEAF